MGTEFLKDYLRDIQKPLLIVNYFFWCAVLMSFYFFSCLYPEELAANFGEIFRAPFAFSYLIIEMCLLALCVCLLRGKNRAVRVVRILLVLLIVTIELGQFISLYYSSDYLLPGVMAHAKLAGLLVNSFTVGTLIVVFSGVVGLFILVARKWSWGSYSSRQLLKALPVIILFITSMMVARRHLEFINETQQTYRAALSPAVQEFFKAFALMNSPADDSHIAIDLSDKDRLNAQRAGIQLDPSQEYPFQKDRYFDKEEGLATIQTKPNVIVLFVESLSADLVGVYHDKWRGVSPNINRFSQEHLQVMDYYNHTTPTIVGVRGQLCSNYPAIDHSMWDNAKFKLNSGEMQCLPSVLNDAGYETTYLGYAQPSETFFKEQMKEVGFQRSYFYKNLLERFVDEGEKPGRGLHGNSDRQMFAGLENFLKARESADRPFFLAMSTIETHPGLDVLDDKMKYADGKSSLLNLVHNFDFHFGKFLEYFYSSPFAENTILILTGDHTHTPSVELRRVSSKEYINDVFNKMTLVIRDPVRDLKGKMSVRSTSVDLAPTILHMLGHSTGSNAFMGRTLFRSKQAGEVSLGLAYRGRLLVLDGEETKVKHLKLESCSKDSQSQLCSYFRILRYSQRLLKNNQFWHR